MAKIVYRKLKKGKKYVYDSSFKTKKGALREAKKQATKYKSYDAGTPFRWGKGWNVYLVKKK